jgi:HTH-type transcriptional regulator / antitoxin HigA
LTPNRWRGIPIQSFREEQKVIAAEIQNYLSREIGMPDPITSDEQNARYTAYLRRLEKQRSLTKAEEKLAEVLTVLIEAYEAQHYEIPKASPLQVLKALLETNGLKQKDLAPIFGSESLVSEVWNKRRELNLKQIKGLAKRFNVSPSVFIAV